MAGIFASPIRCSPLPQLSLGNNDLSRVEEGKFSPPQESTEDIVVVAPTIAPKGILITIIGESVAWGLSVMIMIYTLGHVSGGHFNSAVTIAFAASGRFPWREVPGFVASHVAGSTLAILTLKTMFDKTANIKYTVTQFDYPTTIGEAFAWEFFISFVLMLTICGVATDTRAINELSGVAVGATMIINVLIAGTITGASMNPARSIGPALVARNGKHLWIYIVAPILGTITASMLYSLLRLPVSKNPDKGSQTEYN
ncbi:putative aquaporin NIP4-1 [Actinidia eriantha]|uniref:putative aquaporin NIP4-1 n=1 Tax=Actinidia eriantha TaxID=165200 RepID=UPI00258C173D|nr:putative aquaporin NIP4-1 [Actinidia eriantha]